MKFVILLLLVIMTVPAVNGQAEIRSFVNDEADVLSAEDEAVITGLLQSIYDSGAAEYSVVLVNSLGGIPIEDYAYNVAEGKLGDTEQDNGLLLLIAIEDRQYRFEVGRGLEGELNDAKVGRIGRETLVPNFKQGEYARGIYTASLEIASTLGVDTSAQPIAAGPPPKRLPITFYFYLFFIVLVIFSAAFGGARQSSKNRYFHAAVLAALLMRPPHGGGRIGGGGFGGGSFGGGGASGGW